jgi:hypothetical protein
VNIPLNNRLVGAGPRRYWPTRDRPAPRSLGAVEQHPRAHLHARLRLSLRGTAGGVTYRAPTAVDDRADPAPGVRSTEAYRHDDPTHPLRQEERCCRTETAPGILHRRACAQRPSASWASHPSRSFRAPAGLPAGPSTWWAA